MAGWLKITVSIIVVLVAGWYLIYYNTSNAGYTPEQPVAFSHKLHAGDNHIPCLYCHYNVERSPRATVPSMNVCMGCHSMVAVNKEPIEAITKIYEESHSAEWVKVYDLPDFVHFDHSRHTARGFSCQTCHGQVERMMKLTQVRELNMGWCVSCHRDNDAPDDCSVCHQ